MANEEPLPFEGQDDTASAKVKKMTFQEKLARFSELAREERELEKKLKKVEAEMAALEEPLKDQFSDLGMSNARVGGLTIYLHTQLWAGAAKREIVNADGTVSVVGDAETTCEALIEAGLAEFVKPNFNVNTLSAWVRELPEDQATGLPILPPELEGKISITKKYSLRTRQ